MNSNQKKPGGLSASLSRSKQKDKVGKLSNLRVVRSPAKQREYLFPRSKLVPAGKYHAKIAEILEAVTKNGEDAVDVHYDIVNDSGAYFIKMRYPLESTHFGDLCDALLNAGVPENANLKKGEGVEEWIELDYPNGTSWGTIVSRIPVSEPTSVTDNEDDEDDLLLDDDDDLDEI